MIGQTVISKLLFIVIGILIFLISQIIHLNLVIPFFLITAAIYFRLKNHIRRDYTILHLSLLFLIIFAISYLFIRQGWPVFLIPFCLMPMLATVLFNNLEVSLLLSITSAIAISPMISGNNLYFGILFLASGILSSILVYGARRRMAVIRAGFIVGLAQALLLLLADRFNIFYPERYVYLFLNGLTSGIIVIGILPLFEYLFKTVTNISLLELTDFNHPLLQKMILEAPGTYHHSLVVGNLSEAACQAVGANALLSRVGAYYHDIGKLEKPEYFSENQDLDRSKHDTLSPTMSKLIIMNHVKNGVDLAKKYKINPRLIDFITQHHGDSLVYYFYRRALEGVADDKGVVQEEGFRYPGPKPNTKETAIVLLADSVEAATRAVRDPNPAKIEEMVHKIINNKFIDGQLDECELTLKDLEKISKVFIRILSGIYHSRVTYPEKS